MSVSNMGEFPIPCDFPRQHLFQLLPTLGDLFFFFGFPRPQLGPEAGWSSLAASGAPHRGAPGAAREGHSASGLGVAQGDPLQKSDSLITMTIPTVSACDLPLPEPFLQQESVVAGKELGRGQSAHCFFVGGAQHLYSKHEITSLFQAQALSCEKSPCEPLRHDIAR